MNKIMAKDKYHLTQLIQNEIKQHGHHCDLNHIDVSKIDDMSNIFFESKFSKNASNGVV